MTALKFRKHVLDHSFIGPTQHYKEVESLVRAHKIYLQFFCFSPAKENYAYKNVQF